ncbi:unnamed protein product [Camellia sinensis]
MTTPLLVRAATHNVHGATFLVVALSFPAAVQDNISCNIASGFSINRFGDIEFCSFIYSKNARAPIGAASTGSSSFMPRSRNELDPKKVKGKIVVNAINTDGMSALEAGPAGVIIIGKGNDTPRSLIFPLLAAYVTKEDALIEKEPKFFREHALLTFTLGVRQMICCRNKMDATTSKYSKASGVTQSSQDYQWQYHRVANSRPKVEPKRTTEREHPKAKDGKEIEVDEGMKTEMDTEVDQALHKPEEQVGGDEALGIKRWYPEELVQ